MTSTKQTEATGPNGSVPLNPRRFVLVLERCDNSWDGGSKLVEPGERWAVDLRNDFEDEDEDDFDDDYEIVLGGGARWKTMGVFFYRFVTQLFLNTCSSP